MDFVFWVDSEFIEKLELAKSRDGAGASKSSWGILSFVELLGSRKGEGEMSKLIRWVFFISTLFPVCVWG
jgi:hypothetical protein